MLITVQAGEYTVENSPVPVFEHDGFLTAAAYTPVRARYPDGGTVSQTIHRLVERSRRTGYFLNL